MEQNANAIAALERVMLTVEAELTALHTGEAVNRADLEARLRTDLTANDAAPVRATDSTSPPPPPPPPFPVATNMAAPPPRALTLPAGPNLPLQQPVPQPQPMGRQLVPPQPPSPRQPVSRHPYPVSPPSHPAGPPTTPRNSSLTLERVFRLGGISLVVLAAVFFVSTAISRGWIGPHSQLALAAVTSLAMIAQSFRFAPGQRAWTNTMAIGGSACLFVSGVIGHFGLDILNINIAMAWLGGTILGFLALARAHNAEIIATSGAPAAMLGILLFTASGDASAPVVLGLGTVWALSVLATTHGRSWHLARSAGAGAAAAIITIGALLEPSATTTMVGALLGIASVFALVASQLDEYIRTGASSEQTLVAQIEARLSVMVTPWTVFMAWILLDEGTSLLDTTDTIGWFAVAFGVIVTGAFTAASKYVDPTMVMLHQLAGLGTAALGFVVVLDGPALIASLLVQASISAWFAHRTSAAEMTVGAVFLGAIPTLWTFITLTAGVAGEELSFGEILVSGAVVAIFALASVLLRDRPNLAHLWLASWAGYLVWVAASLQAVPQTQMAISLTWAASAILLIATRPLWSNRSEANRALNVALATLLATGAKLVFVDLVAVDVLWRAALFSVIGATFLRLAFVLPSLLGDDPTSTSDNLTTPDSPASGGEAVAPSEETISM